MERKVVGKPSWPPDGMERKPTSCGFETGIMVALVHKFFLKNPIHSEADFLPSSCHACHSVTLRRPPHRLPLLFFSYPPLYLSLSSPSWRTWSPGGLDGSPVAIASIYARLHLLSSLDLSLFSSLFFFLVYLSSMFWIEWLNHNILPSVWLSMNCPVGPIRQTLTI